MIRAASRRQVLEANTNRFALRPDVQRTKPVDHLGEDASRRHGEPCRVAPIHDLGVRLHPSPAALKAQVPAPLHAHLCLEEPPQGEQERPHGIVQLPRAHRPHRLRATIALRPLSGGPSGVDVRSQAVLGGGVLP